MIQLLHTEWDAGRTVELYDTEDFPIIDTSRSWPEFLNAKSEQFRTKCRQIQDSLEGIEMRPVTDAAQLLAMMRRIKKRSGAKAMPETDFRRTAFTERVIHDAAEAGRLRSMVAFDETLFARPAVGFTTGIEYNGTLHILDTGGDEKYADRAAGIGSFAEMLWGAFDSTSIRRIDVSELDAQAQLERSWATESDRHVSTLILNGGLGSAAVRAGRKLDSFKRAFALPKLRRPADQQDERAA